MSLGRPELEKDFDGKFAAAYERGELNETKHLLKVLRQYTHWYLARADMDGMAKYRVYQAISEAKQLKALGSMSEEECGASMEWLRGYVFALSEAKAAGMWEIETGEAKSKKAFAVGDLMEALKGIEEEEVSTKEPWHAFNLPFRPGNSTAYIRFGCSKWQQFHLWHIKNAICLVRRLAGSYE